MKATIKRVPTSVRFNNALYSRIQKAAMKENRSVSNWIEMAVISFLGDEPNDITKAALQEAQELQKAYTEGKLEPEPVDLSSTESMLRSFGI